MLTVTAWLVECKQFMSCMIACPQVKSADRPGNKMYFEPGAISPQGAEQKADLGKKADFWDMQDFDGPGPETINGRSAMLGECCSAYGVIVCHFSVHIAS